MSICSHSFSQEEDIRGAANFLNSCVDPVIKFLAQQSRTFDGYPIFFHAASFLPALRILSVVSKTRLTNSIIITRPRKTRLYLRGGVYQLADEERHYRSHYRSRKLPLRYVGSFINVDRKITRRGGGGGGGKGKLLVRFRKSPAHRIRTNKYV